VSPGDLNDDGVHGLYSNRFWVKALSERSRLYYIIICDEFFMGHTSIVPRRRQTSSQTPETALSQSGLSMALQP
jgi:hypothetical protein